MYIVRVHVHVYHQVLYMYMYNAMWKLHASIRQPVIKSAISKIWHYIFYLSTEDNATPSMQLANCVKIYACLLVFYAFWISAAIFRKCDLVSTKASCWNYYESVVCSQQCMACSTILSTPTDISSKTARYHSNCLNAKPIIILYKRT